MPWKPRMEDPSKSWPLTKKSSVDALGRHVEVLLDAREVGEADIDEFDVFVFDELEDFVRSLEHLCSLRI